MPRATRQRAPFAIASAFVKDMVSSSLDVADPISWEAASKMPSSTSSTTLDPGQRVCVQNLHSRPALNGCYGCVTNWLEDKERYVVETEREDAAGERVLVKPANLLAVTSPALASTCLPEFYFTLLNSLPSWDASGSKSFVPHVTQWLNSGGNVDARRAPRFDPVTKLAVRTTLLMATCAEGKPLLVAWLLNRGADPALEDGSGQDALRYALASHDAASAEDWRSCILALLAAGAGSDLVAGEILAGASRLGEQPAASTSSSAAVLPLHVKLHVSKDERLMEELRWRSQYRDAAALDPSNFGCRPIWTRRLLGWTRTDILTVLWQVHPEHSMQSRAVELVSLILHEVLSCIVMSVTMSWLSLRDDRVSSSSSSDSMRTFLDYLHTDVGRDLVDSLADGFSAIPAGVSAVEEAVRTFLTGQLADHAITEARKPATAMDQVIGRMSEKRNGWDKLTIRPAGICRSVVGRPCRLRDPKTSIYLAGVLEYLLAEIVELSGNIVKEDLSSQGTADLLPREIGVCDVMNCIRNDEELSDCMPSNDLFERFVKAHLNALPDLGSSASVDSAGQVDCDHLPPLRLAERRAVLRQRVEMAVRAIVEGDEVRVGAYLLDGGDPNAEFASERYGVGTLLTAAVTSAKAAESREGIVKLLLSRKADVDQVDDQGDTALIHACQYGFERIAVLLLAAGASVNVHGENGQTPLSVSAFNNQERLVALLIRRGALIDATDDDGDTALHAAVLEEYADIAARLIKAGARVDVRNNSDRTPLGAAARNPKGEGCIACLNLIRDHVNSAGTASEKAALQDDLKVLNRERLEAELRAQRGSAGGVGEKKKPASRLERVQARLRAQAAKRAAAVTSVVSDSPKAASAAAASSSSSSSSSAAAQSGTAAEASSASASSASASASKAAASALSSSAAESSKDAARRAKMKEAEEAKAHKRAAAAAEELLREELRSEKAKAAKKQQQQQQPKAEKAEERRQQQQQQQQQQVTAPQVSKKERKRGGSGAAGGGGGGGGGGAAAQGGQTAAAPPSPQPRQSPAQASSRSLPGAAAASSLPPPTSRGDGRTDGTAAQPEPREEEEEEEEDVAVEDEPLVVLGAMGRAVTPAGGAAAGGAGGVTASGSSSSSASRRQERRYEAQQAAVAAEAEEARREREAREAREHAKAMSILGRMEAALARQRGGGGGGGGARRLSGSGSEQQQQAALRKLLEEAEAHSNSSPDTREVLKGVVSAAKLALGEQAPPPPAAASNQAGADQAGRLRAGAAAAAAPLASSSSSSSASAPAGLPPPSAPTGLPPPSAPAGLPPPSVPAGLPPPSAPAGLPAPSRQPQPSHEEWPAISDEWPAIGLARGAEESWPPVGAAARGGERSHASAAAVTSSHAVRAGGLKGAGRGGRGGPRSGGRGGGVGDGGLGEGSVDLARANLSAPHGAAPPHAPLAPQPSPQAPQPRQPLLDWHECVVCLDDEQTHALIPCGHLALCGSCAADRSECPLCRVPCTGTLRIYRVS